MKSTAGIRYTRVLFAVLAAICLTAGAASAQSVKCVGKFTLPFDAQWGKTVLRAGDYEFRVVGSNMETRILEIRGKSIILARPIGLDDAKTNSTNALIILQAPGGYQVSEMRLPSLGYSLVFQRRVARHAVTEARARLLLEVPIRAGE